MKNPVKTAVGLNAGWLVACLFLGLPSARADVRLSAQFADSMVLQRDQPIRVWGVAEPGEEVKVSLAGNEVAVKAGTNGSWMVELPAMKEGESLELKVSGKNMIVLKNVIVGDVWLCGGQSNMNFQMKDSLGAAADIAGADFPKIRHIKINSVAPSVFLEEHAPVETAWRACSPQTAGTMTGVGF